MRFVIEYGQLIRIFPAILFVHGYWADGNITWSNIIKKLKQDGYEEFTLFNPTFKNVYGCDPEHAEEIAGWVEDIMGETGEEKIDIVAHSMGALNVRYYIKNLCGYKYARNVIFIAGANHGTVTACLDFVNCGSKQMCVKDYEGAWMENEYLYGINSCDETPHDGILYTSIYSEYDEIIVPSGNSYLDGARNLALEEKAGHAGILFSDETYKYLKDALAGNGLNDNVPSPEGCAGYVKCEPPVENDWTPEASVPDAAEKDQFDLAESDFDHAIDGAKEESSLPSKPDLQTTDEKGDEKNAAELKMPEISGCGLASGRHGNINGFISSFLIFLSGLALVRRRV